MQFKQRLRKSFLVMLKYTLNPITRRVARTRYGPFAIVRHVGRRSGGQYETPIIARRVKDGFVIELTYGPQVDWHKNVLAAGGCRLVWHGREYVVEGITPLDSESGSRAFSPFQQRVLRLLRRTHFELMQVKS